MVFELEEYDGWTGLSFEERKAKAEPFAQMIDNTWARLKRALPEMQSAAKPFEKGKWDERGLFLVQDALYEDMDRNVITV